MLLCSYPVFIWLFFVIGLIKQTSQELNNIVHSGIYLQEVLDRYQLKDFEYPSLASQYLLKSVTIFLFLTVKVFCNYSIRWQKKRSNAYKCCDILCCRVAYPALRCIFCVVDCYDYKKQSRCQEAFIHPDQSEKCSESEAFHVMVTVNPESQLQWLCPCVQPVSVSPFISSFPSQRQAATGVPHESERLGASWFTLQSHGPSLWGTKDYFRKTCSQVRWLHVDCF